MHDISLVTYFSGKSLRFMPPDALILAQNATKCVWRPGYARTLWGSSQRSHRPPSWIQGVLLLREREGECAQFCIQIWGIEAPDPPHQNMAQKLKICTAADDVPSSRKFTITTFGVKKLDITQSSAVKRILNRSVFCPIRLQTCWPRSKNIRRKERRNISWTQWFSILNCTGWRHAGTTAAKSSIFLRNW